MKKYIYPLIVAGGFTVCWQVLVGLLNGIFGTEGYRGMGIGTLMLSVWVVAILPVYCVRYGTILVGEKAKGAFCVYNCLLLTVAHICPLDLQGYIVIVILFILWVLLWNIVGVAWRSSSCDGDRNHCE